MLATGGSLDLRAGDAARSRRRRDDRALSHRGASRESTSYSRVTRDVAIVAAALDEEFNDVGYITPGTR